MRTSNPVLRENILLQQAQENSGGAVMTIEGAVYKTFILLGALLVTAGLVWRQGATTGDPASVTGWMIGGLIVGLILAVITCFVPRISMVTAPLYALAEGAAVGGISWMMEQRYPGIVLPAVGLTFGTLAAMLAAYLTGVIRATPAFTRGIIVATLAIGAVYLVSIVLRLFSVSVPFIHDAGWMGIGFSLFVVTIAALNLILDFALIEDAAAQGMPRYMEWYGAFGLIVTLVWLYIEILRLLSKLQRR